MLSRVSHPTVFSLSSPTVLSKSRMPLDNLPVKSFTLEEIVDLAKNLLLRRARDKKEDHLNFVKLMLAGIYDGHQVVVDPIRNALTAIQRISGNRDIDSFFAICKHINVLCGLTVFPIPKREDTLTKNIHLEYEFTTAAVSFLLLNVNVNSMVLLRVLSRPPYTRFQTRASASGVSTPSCVSSYLACTATENTGLT